ncbi:hypothetical protein H6S82_00050 [Planktothrix sp. FACHB-1355]|uniref:Uncharacterized protein n=1 Tax=Aerosakkonema funiforme FACHB-1375 TaxID=2949571 RepID=A0A926VFV6_9CYAN|nr:MULTISPECIES: hypothetical protein [Oscillatoriales]MBD2181844.1 hypothetical protein [Aerosakkonema funiforme FACHB-1375]MBD3557264.1 hypothetical protein [Planktothrix sp. FACHB-1355]
MNTPPPETGKRGRLQLAQEFLGWLLTVLLAVMGGFQILSGQWQDGGVLLAISAITYPLNRLPDWIRLLLSIPAGIYLFSVTLD